MNENDRPGALAGATRAGSEKQVALAAEFSVTSGTFCSIVPGRSRTAVEP
jgi:hypothetical protein